MIVVDANSINLHIGESALVRGVSLSVRAGEIISIVGPNGAGKTSLLKILSGDLKPSSGEVRFLGKALNAWPIKALAKRRAVLPQLSPLNFPYKVEEVVALGRSPHSTGQTIDQGIVQQLMSDLDLEYLQGRPYPRLSGGEKQRTQLARVMAQTWQEDQSAPNLLILDEPTNALDLGHQQQVIYKLKSLASTGTAIVIVVHDLNIAATISDKLLLMCCGEPMAFGSPNEVLNEDMLSKVFRARIRVQPNPHDGGLLILS